MKKLIDVNKTKSKVDIKESIVKASASDIAVIGIGLRIGRHQSIAPFWKDLCYGYDFIRSLPDERKPDIIDFLSLTAAEKAEPQFRELAYLQSIDKFDYSFFKLSPKEAALLSPRQRIFLETMASCLDDAGYGGERLKGSNTGIYVGSTSYDDYYDYLKESAVEDTNLLLSVTTDSMKASRLSYILDLKGPALLVDTACSSSLMAVHLAVNALRSNQCSYAIAGGIKIIALPIAGEEKTEIESSDNRAHPFDDYSDGTGGGEGSIAFLLKPLNKARNDNDHIYGVIKGSAANQDGASIGITAPNADAQADVITKAWNDANIDPASIGYIEAHGTGTKLGDPIEIDGLSKAFGRFTRLKQFCGIGSIKANLGHLDDAAGAAGFLKALLTLYYKQIPPLINFKKPNNEISFQHSPLYPVTKLTGWDTSTAERRRAGVSSFGLSGTNVHIVLEEYVTDETKVKDTDTDDHFYPVPLSAKSPEALNLLVHQMLRFLYANPNASIKDIAYTLWEGRGHYKHRFACCVNSISGFIEAVVAYLNNDKADGKNYFYSGNPKTTSTDAINSSTDMLLKEWETSPSDANAAATAQSYVNDNAVSHFSAGNKKYNKISLPGYQFEIKRCWVTPAYKEAHAATIDNSYMVKTDDGIFINEKITDFDDSKLFLIRLSLKKFWLLREHQLNGSGVLVATAYLQIASEAAKIIFNSNTVSLSNLYFNSLLSVGDKNELPVFADCKRRGHQWEIAFRDAQSSAAIRLYGGMNLDVSIPAPGKSLPIHDIIKTTDIIYDAQTDTAEFDSRITVSADGPWNCLKRIYRGEHYSIAQIEVNDTYGDFASYFCYPPVLDVALNFAFTEKGYLPYRYGEAHIFAKTPEQFFSIAELNQNPAPGYVSFNLQLVDTAGQLFAVINNYVLKKDNMSIDSSFFNAVEWIEKPAYRSNAFLPEQKLLLINLTDTEFPVNADSSGMRLLNQGIDTFTIKDMISAIDQGYANIIVAADAEHYGSVNDFKEFTKKMEPWYNIVSTLANYDGGSINLIYAALDGTDNPAAGYLSPYTAAAASFALVLSQENSSVNALCIETDESLSVQMIAEELYLDKEIFYRIRKNGKRFLQSISPITYHSEPQKPVPIRESGSYLLTGGTGGVALELAHQLADISPIHFILLTNEDFPEEDTWAAITAQNQGGEIAVKIGKLQELLRKGASLSILKADITDEHTLSEKLTETEANTGTIHGIIHCAGLPGGGLLKDKKWYDAIAVLRPKILGAVHLHNYFKKRNPDFFILCSSATSLTGGAGQADYTAANAFLDAIAQETRSATAVLWPAWLKTGMTASIDIESVHDPVTPITAGEGRDLFINALTLKRQILLAGKLKITDFKAFNKHFLISNDFREEESESSGLALSIKSNFRIKDAENPDTLLLTVAGCWGAVLGYDELGLHDNFYEIGGDSISAMRIAGILEKECGVRITINDIFTHLTISELTDAINKKKDTDSSSSVPDTSNAADGTRFPLTPQQEYIYHLERISNNVITYHIAEVFKWEGEFDADRFRRALMHLAEKQEALRTAISFEDGQLQQTVVDLKDFPVPIKTIPEKSLQQELAAFIRPFDLHQPPLLHIAIFRIKKSSTVIAFDFHHILFDAFSLGIFYDELIKAYYDQTLMPPSLSFTGFVKKQAENRSQEQNDEDIEYWNEIIALRDKPLLLPADFSRTNDIGYQAGTASAEINATLCSQLRTYSKEEKVSEFNILHAALILALAKLSNEKIIPVGISISGRDNPDVENTIGMFAKNIPVMVNVDAAKTATAFVKQVQKSFQKTLQHSSYPFHELLLKHHTDTAGGYDPFYPVIFSYIKFENQSSIQGGPLNEYRDAPLPLNTEYDFYIYGYDNGDTISIHMKYKTALYKEETAKQLLSNMIQNAVKIPKKKGEPIGNLFS